MWVRLAIHTKLQHPLGDINYNLPSVWQGGSIRGNHSDLPGRDHGVMGSWNCGVAKSVFFCWICESMEECWGAVFFETGGMVMSHCSIHG